MLAGKNISRKVIIICLKHPCSFCLLLTSSSSFILPGQVLGKYSYLSSSMRGIVAAVAALVAHLALTTGGVAGAWPGGTDGWYYAIKFPINCCLVE